jgi:hypothetical protein
MRYLASTHGDSDAEKGSHHVTRALNYFDSLQDAASAVFCIFPRYELTN